MCSVEFKAGNSNIHFGAINPQKLNKRFKDLEANHMSIKEKLGEFGTENVYLKRVEKIATEKNDLRPMHLADILSDLPKYVVGLAKKAYRNAPEEVSRIFSKEHFQETVDKLEKSYDEKILLKKQQLASLQKELDELETNRDDVILNDAINNICSSAQGVCNMLKHFITPDKH